MNGLVAELNMGSEAVRLYWEKDPNNGRMFLKGGKYQYVYGTGMALNIQKYANDQYPKFVSIQEAPSFGIQIDWEVEEKSLQEEIAKAKERKAKIDELTGRNTRMITPTQPTPVTSVSEVDSAEAAKLEAENDDLKKKLLAMEERLAAMESAKESQKTATKKTTKKDEKTEGGEDSGAADTKKEKE